MRRGMFAVGMLAGVLLAGAVVLGSSLASGNGMSGMATPAEVTFTGAAVESVTSTTTATMTTTATASSVSSATVPQLVANASSSSAYTASSNDSGQTAFLTGLSSQLPQHSPSAVSRIVERPIQSILFLLPIAFAALLGLALHRVSSVRA